MFYQTFHSPQVKQSLIISNKLVYTSYLKSCQTTEDLRPQEIRKVLNNVKVSWKLTQCLVLLPKKMLSILAKDSVKVEVDLLPQCAILHGNQSFSQIFWPYLQLIRKSDYSEEVPAPKNFLKNTVNQKEYVAAAPLLYQKKTHSLNE